MKSFKVMSAAILMGAAFAALSVVPSSLADSGPKYTDCNEAAQAGDFSVPESSPNYRKSMDWDRDGVACEPVEKLPADSGSGS